MWHQKLSADWQPDYDFLSLYIDVPFCLRRCSYCVFFKSEEKANSAPYRQYFDQELPGLIDRYQKILERATIKSCYIGGGTANLMTTQVMRSLFDRIPGFREIPLKKMEGHPALFTKEKIDLLGEYKFTDISMGVQTFNGPLLSRFNRIPFPVEKTKNILDYAVAKGLRVNCDLLAFADTGGLADLEILHNDLSLLASQLHPSYITIYPLYQLFTASRNQALHEQREVLINRIAHLRCAVTSFQLRFPEYRQFDVENATVTEVLGRDGIWNRLSMVYTLSRLPWKEQSSSFIYLADYFYEEHKYPFHGRQNVIGLGGARQGNVFSFICDKLYYLTFLDENNTRFLRRMDCSNAVSH